MPTEHVAAAPRLPHIRLHNARVRAGGENARCKRRPQVVGLEITQRSDSPLTPARLEGLSAQRVGVAAEADPGRVRRRQEQLSRSYGPRPVADRESGDQAAQHGQHKGRHRDRSVGKLILRRVCGRLCDRDRGRLKVNVTFTQSQCFKPIFYTSEARIGVLGV